MIGPGSASELESSHGLMLPFESFLVVNVHQLWLFPSHQEKLCRQPGAAAGLCTLLAGKDIVLAGRDDRPAGLGTALGAQGDALAVQGGSLPGVRGDGFAVLGIGLVALDAGFAVLGTGLVALGAGFAVLGTELVALGAGFAGLHTVHDEQGDTLVELAFLQSLHESRV